MVQPGRYEGGGVSGQGLLRLDNQAILHDTDGYLGFGSLATGEAILSNGAQWINDRSLTIGQFGQGKVTVQNSARLSVSSAENWGIRIAPFPGSTGALNIGAAPGSAPVAPGTIDTPFIQLGAADAQSKALSFGEGDATLNLNHNQTDYALPAPIIGTGNVNLLAGGSSLNLPQAFNGDLNVYSGAILSLRNQRSWAGNVNNAGEIRLTDSANPWQTLNVKNDYYSDHGRLVMNSELAGDNAKTGKLVIAGNSSGVTWVDINNPGGRGAATDKGIEIVSVAGESAGIFRQTRRLVAGPYEYALVRGNDKNGASSRNWYLSNSPAAADPRYRSEMGGYISNIAAANTLFNHRLQDREKGLADINPLTGQPQQSTMWMRNSGGHLRSRDSSQQLSTQSNRYVLQLGGDIYRQQQADDSLLRFGIMAGYGNAHSHTRSDAGSPASRAEIDGYSAGLYGIWYGNSDGPGGYLDSWLLYNWFNNRVEGQQVPTERYKSRGITASLEAGYAFSLSENRQQNLRYFVQPQAQIIYMGVKDRAFTESGGSSVSSRGDDNLQTRLGGKLYLQGYSHIDEGKNRLFEPALELNWIHNSHAFGSAIDDNALYQAGARNIGEVKLGVTGKINKRFHLNIDVGEQRGEDHYRDARAAIGMQYQF